MKLSECQKCVLYKHRTQVVKGRGNKKALSMWVGEAPGRNEDQYGIPFWPKAPAGKNLTKMIGYAGFSRDEVWITNANKCRPKDNRTPKATEADACFVWLENEIRVIKPGVIVTLGANALRVMIGSSKISQFRGRFLFIQGVYFVAMYHPAAICYGTEERREEIKNFNIQDSKMIYEYFFNRILPEVEAL